MIGIMLALAIFGHDRPPDQGTAVKAERHVVPGWSDRRSDRAWWYYEERWYLGRPYYRPSPVPIYRGEPTVDPDPRVISFQTW